MITSSVLLAEMGGSETKTPKLVIVVNRDQDIVTPMLDGKRQKSVPIKSRSRNDKEREDAATAVALKQMLALHPDLDVVLKAGEPAVAYRNGKLSEGRAVLEMGCASKESDAEMEPDDADDIDGEDDDAEDMGECLGRMEAALASAKRIVENGQPPRMDLFIAAIAEGLVDVCRSTGRVDLVARLKKVAVEAVVPYETSMADYQSVQLEDGSVVDGSGWLAVLEKQKPSSAARPERRAAEDIAAALTTEGSADPEATPKTKKDYEAALAGGFAGTYTDYLDSLSTDPARQKRWQATLLKQAADERQVWLAVLKKQKPSSAARPKRGAAEDIAAAMFQAATPAELTARLKLKLEARAASKRGL
jgi:hypothetical protein